jgi:hypothetical protein
MLAQSLLRGMCQIMPLIRGFHKLSKNELQNVARALEIKDRSKAKNNKMRREMIETHLQSASAAMVAKQFYDAEVKSMLFDLETVSANEEYGDLEFATSTDGVKVYQDEFVAEFATSTDGVKVGDLGKRMNELGSKSMRNRMENSGSELYDALSPFDDGTDIYMSDHLWMRPDGSVYKRD